MAYDNRLPGERVRVERRQEQRSLRDIVDRRELARGDWPEPEDAWRT